MARKNLLNAKLVQLRHGRWTKADARLVLDAVERSGETVAAFARTHELSAQKIFWWRSQLASEQRSTQAESISFAPVVVTGLGRSPVAVVRRGTLEIEIHEPNEVDTSWLASLLRAADGSEA